MSDRGVSLNTIMLAKKKERLYLKNINSLSMKLFLDIIDIILNISWFANTAALIASTILGIIWFHPRVFGTAWMHLVKFKKTDATKKHAKISILWNLPITFILAANISAFCKHLDYRSAIEGFLIGYDLGLIICLFMGMHYFYEQRSIKLYGIVA
jgi:hypothetical protein